MAREKAAAVTEEWNLKVAQSPFLVVSDPPRTSHKSVIYVIQDEAGFIKIGHSIKLAERLKTLTRVAGPLRLIGVAKGGIEREVDLHQCLRAWRADRPRRIGGRVLDAAGTEWFWDTSEFREELARKLRITVDELRLPPEPWSWLPFAVTG